MQEFAGEALPQRAPRERRSAKRAKTDEAAGGAPEADSGAAAGGDGSGVAAAAAAAPAEQRPEQQQQQQQQQQQGAEAQQGSDQQPSEEQQQQQPDGCEGGDAMPAAAQLDLPAYRSAAVNGQKFEYLDHTADVQLHAWGETLREAFENVGLCMFNYMTPLKGIGIDPALTRTYEAEGHDLQSLLFNFLDELLFAFATEFFVAKQLRITRFDRDNWRIMAEGQGETFDRQRHVCGTEVKAITYSAMQINETQGDAEVFVIVDI
ncbi:archease-like [Chlorella sorokiniana]|uniref:Archease-like n=1 Tax=Chlorella sorokiniana TaxID=3076 RepID=A0A2P6TT68_CHLSO|nr:archease-like [Chlorella sorokiniana]|eukprot:PRW57244.1 archease-like [Chlorella sorokiniana]